MRGKLSPKDVDLLIIFRDSEDRDVAYGLKRMLEDSQPPVELILKTWESLMSPAFKAREAIMWEGWSFRFGKPFASCWGFVPRMLFRYGLAGISPSRRVMFYHSLHGRDGSRGMLARLRMVRFADRVLSCPVESVDEARVYLRSWGLDVEETRVLLPERQA